MPHRLPMLLLAAAFAAACEAAATAEPNSNPEVATIRLTVGGQQISVDALGTETGGPLVMRAGTTVSVNSSFHMTNGLVDSRVTSATFQLNLEPIAGAPLEFQRSATNPFGGTLTASAETGGARLQIELFDVEHQRTQFGPYSITVVIGQ